MSRDYVLHKVRTALGRSSGEAPAQVPEVLIRIPDVPMEDRIRSFCQALEALGGTTHRASSLEAARAHVESYLEGRTAIASNAPLLAECGVTSLSGVSSGLEGKALREACATAGVGITSADYALADTGSLVMLSSLSEARMVSLLPPAHLAVLPLSRMLTGLDELYTLIPLPAEQTSSMVFITGPSRTADIEQILVRGVHGPGQICVVLLEDTAEGPR